MYPPLSYKSLVCIKAVILTCSVKNVILKISQNSQENTCPRATFLRNTCFPVHYLKLLRTPVFTEHTLVAASIANCHQNYVTEVRNNIFEVS